MNAVFRALSDPTRRRVLQLLRKKPLTAGELSAHFAVLREADLIESTKVGTTITYQLKLSVLEDALLGFAQTVGWEPEKARRNGPRKSLSVKEAR